MNKFNNAWYRSGWFWAVCLIPFAAVVFGILMFVMAVLYKDDVVVDDYYKEGMAINKVITLLENATQQDINLIFFKSMNRRYLYIKNTESESITLTMFHVVDRSLDQTFLLQNEGGGYFRLNSNLIRLLTSNRGAWNFSVTSNIEKWRVNKKIHSPVHFVGDES